MAESENKPLNETRIEMNTKSGGNAPPERVLSTSVMDTNVTPNVTDINSDDDEGTPTNKNNSNNGNDIIKTSKDDDDDDTYLVRVKDVLIQFLPLGLIAFGGPTAHIAILHERFVETRKWLDEQRFVELLAVGQGLPGPTSTQMVISCGAYRGGLTGGLLSFFCWNLPSFIVLTLAGLGVSSFIKDDPDWMAGLPPAAVSLVFVAAYKLSAKVVDTKIKIFMCLLSSMIVTIVSGDKRVTAREAAIVYPVIIFSGGLITLIDSKIPYYNRASLYDNIRDKSKKDRILKVKYLNKYTSIILSVGWIILLILMISLRGRGVLPSILEFFESMFRIGSIIYGGGQVVLPMLFDEVVSTGWVTEEQFWAGFALVQALPGPLFNFSAYLGAVGFGIAGAFIGWAGLFGPGLMLIFAFLPLWDWVHQWEWFRIFLQGVNATAIGLVISACIILWNSAINNAGDASVSLLTASLVAFIGLPAPLAILIGGVVGWLFSPSIMNIGQDPFCLN